MDDRMFMACDSERGLFSTCIRRPRTGSWINRSVRLDPLCVGLTEYARSATVTTGIPAVAGLVDRSFGGLWVSRSVWTTWGGRRSRTVNIVDW